MNPKNYAQYKGLWLKRGSRSYELFEAGELKILDQHLKEVAQKEKELLKRYDKPVAY